MTVVETILVFAVAPLAVVLLFAVLTLGPGVRNRRPRYKPGQPWEHAPIWYEPHPDGAAHGSDHGGETAAIGSSVYGERHGADAAATHAVSGGTSAGGTAVSGTSAGGSSAAGLAAPKPAGPLGGARGTW